MLLFVPPMLIRALAVFCLTDTSEGDHTFKVMEMRRISDMGACQMFWRASEAWPDWTCCLCSLVDDQQYEYGEDLGVTAVALYDYQAGEEEATLVS